ncbi:hypothetical protein HQ865_11850 [Mucilaginibacter mali]|uniref:Uncharacterized protein n=1 Tax=Mucilaginibacter mali TaxID=2740462 RepID=A0A7D4UDD9_9SPHI|nr:hypothetical protein [Mucilaginibacter mali]QKJ30419.1 hypothetical protein HQ865_11850 [Mucilaginibacter mali]
MPEVTIKYKKPETLKILKGLAKYFDFVISTKPEAKGTKPVDDIIIPGDKSLDISVLDDIFTGKNLDAKQLRKDAWERKK